MGIVGAKVQLTADSRRLNERISTLMAIAQPPQPWSWFMQRSAAADQPFGDEGIRYPTQPGDCDIRGAERPVQRKKHHGQVVAEGDRGKSQGEVTDHPAAVGGDISAADLEVGLQASEEPQNRENSEAKVSGEAFFRN
jgi:hypothetical protein